MTTTSPDRAVITVAQGKPFYFRLATNLVRSFLFHRKDERIACIVATDDEAKFPEDVRRAVRFVRVDAAVHGIGFSPKLWLDRLSPANRTLFLDSDCIVYGDLAPVFDRFAGHALSCIGRMETHGEFYGDIAERCARFGVPALPKLMGALYYLEAGERCTAACAKARALEKEYDALGFKRLRDRPNEEPLLSIAMALHGERPLTDDGSIKADAIDYRHGIDTSVLRGYAAFRRREGEHQHLPLLATPLIGHYPNEFIELPAYRADEHALALHAGGASQVTARIRASLLCRLPLHAKRTIKNTARPLFHLVAGPRKVRRSDRL